MSKLERVLNSLKVSGSAVRVFSLLFVEGGAVSFQHGSALVAWLRLFASTRIHDGRVSKHKETKSKMLRWRHQGIPQMLQEVSRWRGEFPP